MFSQRNNPYCLPLWVAVAQQQAGQCDVPPQACCTSQWSIWGQPRSCWAPIPHRLSAVRVYNRRSSPNRSGCVWLCKDTNLKANHNTGVWRLRMASVCMTLQRYTKKWEQATFPALSSLYPAPSFVPGGSYPRPNTPIEQGRSWVERGVFLGIPNRTNVYVSPFPSHKLQKTRELTQIIEWVNSNDEMS